MSDLVGTELTQNKSRDTVRAALRSNSDSLIKGPKPTESTCNNINLHFESVRSLITWKNGCARARSLATPNLRAQIAKSVAVVRIGSPFFSIHFPIQSPPCLAPLSQCTDCGFLARRCER